MKPFPIVVAPGHGRQDSGAVDNGLVERDLVGPEAGEVVRILRTRGWSAFLGPQPGPAHEHDARVVMANSLHAVLLVLHMNSGGGQYARVEVTEENPSPDFARFLAARMKACMGDLITEVQTITLAPGDRGHVCLAGAERSACLVEPLFLDNDAHAEWLRSHDNREALCTAYADAVDDLGAHVGMG